MEDAVEEVQGKVKKSQLQSKDAAKQVLEKITEEVVEGKKDGREIAKKALEFRNKNFDI